MEDKLIEVLTSIVPIVIRQGSLAPNEDYPQEFFTFWNNDSSDGAHYDNEANSVLYDYDINFYSTSPERTHSVLAEAIAQLKANGWIIDGRGHDVASDEITHTGRGVNVLFLNV